MHGENWHAPRAIACILPDLVGRGDQILRALLQYCFLFALVNPRGFSESPSVIEFGCSSPVMPLAASEDRNTYNNTNNRYGSDARFEALNPEPLGTAVVSLTGDTRQTDIRLPAAVT